MSEIFYTPYNREEILTALQRALGDLTDAQVLALHQQEADARAAGDAQLSEAIAAVIADLTAHYVQTTALTAETDARTAADAKHTAGLTDALDGGAKNKMPVRAGSNQTGDSWFQTAVDLPKDTYVVSLGTLQSDDTDATVCRGIFLAADHSNASSYFMMQRGTNVSAAVTLTKPAAFFRLNPSDTVAHSSGDTLSYTDAMICTKAAWDISPAFVPYCPTMQALYQMILDLQPTRAANFSADQFKAAGQPETEADNA